MRIGLIRLSSLGDVVLTTGIIRELKNLFGDAEITMITSSRYMDIFRFNPYLKKTIGLEGKNIKELFRLGRRVRKELYDVLVDLHINPRSLIMSTISRSRKRLRYAKCRWLRSMMVFRKDRKACEHVVIRYFKPFEKMGLKSMNLRPEVWLDEETRRSAGRLIDGANIPLVAISPGAKRPTKRWLPENYGRLCSLLLKTGRVKVVLLGDLDDIEVAEKVKKSTKGHLIDLTGKTSLLQLAAVLERSSVLVTNDSGPMHMASAVNTPVVAIFGPTVPEFGFYPLGERDKIIQRQLPCRPCSLHGSERCRDDSFKCMRLITAEEVFEEVFQVIDDQ